MTRVDATNAAESAGAKVDPSVTENTSIRVAGWGAGTEEDDDAKAKGVEIWTEDQFVAAASGGKQKDASSAEEQEEAPTAKEAKPDEQLRVRARDGEEVMLSRDAARLMGTLKDLMDLATSEDGIYPTPTIMASTFQMVCKLNDPDYTWPSSDEQSLSQLIQLIEDALYLDASKVALKHIQRAIASRLNGKCTPELCALLGAVGDFGSADEHTASIAEPAFAPENFEAPQQPASSTPSPALLQQPSFSGDAMEAALGLVDVATLVELKGPAMMLAKIGAERGIMLSGIMLTDQKEADLSCQDLQPADAILIASDLKFMVVLTSVDLRANSIGDDGAKAIAEALKVNAVLKNCNLLKNRLDVESATMLAKIGRERGIMLSGMKRDQREVSFFKEGLQPADAILIGSDLQSMAVLKNCNLLKNNLGIQPAMMLAKIGAEKGIMLSGMKRDQTEVSFFNEGFQPADAILIASDLKFMAVLTTLNLWSNSIGDEGAMAIAEALKVNAVVTTLALGNNNIGNDGAKAIAEALKVNVVLTKLVLWEERN
ncbi:hypothetical protein Ctob_008046 [Chrysochromulina tobinii]|uniref:Protein nlrc3 n=1 Tax=Chrysochromulina tobinii TaxID=1460289 RepID=A0A0M0K504_9EUKA|nr:hypothetical protein Ctob_008046 [Chrysochromulina tobinii]|eukprot:KOO33894.1 hypothetical protein Ctob_008046 [Chrysochromulina sp. CCMP291]